uniref:Uncharacterized protein n=1 Tax=Panagrolaimus sp. ES5 TaxID=591445 RepID=A0AC34GH02_9BILA
MTYFTLQWSTVTYSTVEARLNLISMKFSESIDLSSSYFGVLNSINIQGFGSFGNVITISCQKNTIPPSCGCTVPVFTTTAMPTTTIAASTTEMPTTEKLMTAKVTTKTPSKFSTEAPSTCTAAPNAAEIYIENGVVLSDHPAFSKAQPV